MMLSELDNYRHRIDDLRSQVGELISSLSAPVLNRHPFAEGDGKRETVPANSLAALTAHIAGAERFWVSQVIGRRQAGRDRAAELVLRVDDVSELLHVVDHTALHLGHMQLTYRLWHGGAAVSSPFWFRRLPQEAG